MASSNRPSNSSVNTLEQWYLMAAAILVCMVLGYLVYDAIMSTAAELLQQLVMVSPLLLIIVVHWLSSNQRLTVPIPGSEPDAIHRAGGSPCGIAIVVLLLLFVIVYQPSLHGLLY